MQLLKSFSFFFILNACSRLCLHSLSACRLLFSLLSTLHFPHSITLSFLPLLPLLRPPMSICHAFSSLSCARDSNGDCNLTRLEWGFHRAYVEGDDEKKSAYKWSKSGPYRGFCNLFLIGYVLCERKLHDKEILGAQIAIIFE